MHTILFTRERGKDIKKDNRGHTIQTKLDASIPFRPPQRQAITAITSSTHPLTTPLLRFTCGSWQMPQAW